MVTSVAYDSKLGVMITFFSGSFKVLDPFAFETVVWEYREGQDSQSHTESRATYTTSAYSQKLAYFAVGSVEGTIVMFDINSKSKVGRNDTAHVNEIVKIFFFDTQT